MFNEHCSLIFNFNNNDSKLSLMKISRIKFKSNTKIQNEQKKTMLKLMIYEISEIK